MLNVDCWTVECLSLDLFLFFYRNDLEMMCRSKVETFHATALYISLIYLSNLAVDKTGNLLNAYNDECVC